MKSLHRILFALFLAVSAVSGCTDPVEEIPVTISLNKTLMSALPVGSQQQLEAVVKPDGADVTVVWESDNEAVASVDADGIVSGVSVGTAVITASVGDASAECKVTVVAVKPTAISLTPTKLHLKTGDTKELVVAFTPAEAVAEDLVWETSDASVAAVKDGVVTAAGEGEATVTVKCNGGNLAAVCRVSVAEDYVPVYVTEMQLTPSEMSLEAGQKKTIKVTYLPADAEEVTDLEWETSDADVAKVENGTVEAVKAGKAVITAKCMDGTVTATCQVTVSEKEEPEPGPGEGGLQAVAINAVGGKADVQVGMELQLELACTPSNAVPSSVTWSVDTDMFASIDDNGLLKGKYAEKDASGWKSVVVTVNADGKEASLVVRVIPRQAEEIRVDVPENNRIKVGSGWTFNPVIYPEGLGFNVMAICSYPAYSVLEGVCYTQPGTPGRYSYTFTLSGHENLLDEYNVKTYVDIDVEPYWVETVSIDSALEMETGSSTTLIPTYTSDKEGVEPTYKDVQWKSSDEAVVKVDGKGNVTAVGTGEATVTVTTSSEWSVPSGSEQKSASCKVTVTQAANPVYVGDYFYSDGTWSTELQSGKTVVGVVFATANATSTDPQLKKDYPECTHGLVVSVKEYDSPIAMVSGADYSWNSVNNYALELGGYASMAATDIICGYSNTQAMKAFKAAKGDYSKYLDVIDGHDVSVAGASTWYMPSQYELSLIGADYSVINERLAAVGDQFEEFKNSWDSASRSGIYWSSTYLDGLGSQSKPYILSTNQLDGSMKMHSHSYQVRLVFAF